MARNTDQATKKSRNHGPSMRGSRGAVGIGGGSVIGTIGKRISRAIVAMLLLSAPSVYAQGILNPDPRYQFLDNSGKVCAACTLAFFTAGTSTPQNVFSDQGLTTPVANPLTLDSAGRPPVGNLYFSAVAYKVVYKDALGSTLWTSDNVPGGYSASIIIAGTLSTARLGSGSATSSTFLRGDSTWAVPAGGDFGVCDLRLTLESGNPYSTTDQTAKTSVFVTPLKGGRCGFYDGVGTWTVLTNTEQTISVAATTGTLYDVWCRNNSGTIACDTTAWTNDTTRATALTTQNAIYVKSGDTTRRYVGTFRTTTVSGQTEDSFAKRYVWSYYDRVRRPLRVTEATATWNYTIATLRCANTAGACVNQLDVVIGVAEVGLEVEVYAASSNTAAANVTVSIGEDSTSASATGVMNSPATPGATSGNFYTPRAALKKFPAVGRHFYAWLEYSVAAGTTTWYGVAAPTAQSGIHGTIEG